MWLCLSVFVSQDIIPVEENWPKEDVDLINAGWIRYILMQQMT